MLEHHSLGSHTFLASLAPNMLVGALHDTETVQGWELVLAKRKEMGDKTKKSAAYWSQDAGDCLNAIK